MHLTLLSLDGTDPRPYAAELEQADLRVRCADGTRLPESAMAVVAIHRQPSLINLAQAIDPLLPALRDRPWVLCSPIKDPGDGARLDEVGVRDRIAPAGWGPRQVADRILGWWYLHHPCPAAIPSLVGQTPGMRAIHRAITQLGPLPIQVLVRGESGTGKELVARALHETGGRSGQFVAFNVASIRPELMSSELFGHARGAFTGADRERRGLMLEAGTGTVFLDEIGDLSLEAQTALLRVIEEREVRPVGDNRSLPLRARLLFATHQDLDARVAEGRFREDLYYRIAAETIQLPPLRDRMGDLPLLAAHLLGSLDAAFPGRARLPVGSLDLLFRHGWPGNVRELRNVLQSAAARGSKGTASLEVLQQATRPRGDAAPAHRASLSFDPTRESWSEVHDRALASYLRSVLEACGGNRTLAVQRSGLSRSQFYELLRKHSVEVP